MTDQELQAKIKAAYALVNEIESELYDRRDADPDNQERQDELSSIQNAVAGLEEIEDLGA